MSFSERGFTPQQDILTTFYTRLYDNLGRKHDSPDKSRVSLAKAVAEYAKDNPEGMRVLDIGSGRQSLERQIISAHKNKHGVNSLQLFTIDIADIPHHKLLEQRNDNVHHSRGSALRLPFADNSFKLIVSNHAVDFLPRNAFGEIYRVLTSQGACLFNFHHPALLKGIDSVTNKDVHSFWTYLKETNGLFASEAEISNTLLQYGFTNTQVSLDNDHNDTWWKVTAYK